MLKKLKLNGSMKTYKTFRTNTQKRCAFHYRGLESKSRKSRNTWSNRQIWPWRTEWRRAKANRVLLKKKNTGYIKQPLLTTQEKTTHGHHQMANTKIRLILFFAAKDGEALYSLKKQDGERIVAQMMTSDLKLKKVGKTTWPFSCDLNQIPYDYTVEVRNRFKGLGLIDRLPDELWTKARDIVQETGIKTIPKKKKCKKSK